MKTIYADFIDKANAEEAAGQMIVTGFDGTAYGAGLASIYKKFKPGGVILFRQNIESLEQTAALIADIVKLSEDVTGLPPFVCVDQEGGRVSRLPKSYIFPTARELAGNGGEERVFENYAMIGKILRETGFNVDFAPVLDLDTNPDNPIIGDRSFGANPDIAIKMGLAAIRGLRSEGIMSCGKHFPGHGDTILDSHLDLPVDDRSALRFEDAELRPFEAAIADNVDFIMTAHVIYPAFDPANPATLSKKIVTDLLRDKMGFGGVIVGDDMDMKAIADRYDDEESAKMALAAGCDMLLVCHEGPRQAKVFSAARRMVDSGIMGDQNTRERLARLMRAKEKIASN